MTRISLLLSAIMGLFLISCFGGCLRKPSADMRLGVTHLAWKEGEQQSRLLVFLPGIRDKADDFVKNGFWDDLKSSGASFDVASVDAHIGYYRSRRLAEVLWNEVIQPARQKGYEEIWVCGISLGGLGALLSEKMYPGMWNGMILMAPFLGDDQELFKELDEAGGVLQWAPKREYAPEEFQWRLWSWLADDPWGEALVDNTYLGYGESDRLRRGIVHLVPLVPKERVFTIDGRHKWKTWRSLWQEMLKRIE